MECGVGKR